jgi:predicted small secreted protein
MASNPLDAVTLEQRAGQGSGAFRRTMMTRTISALFTAALLLGAATMLSACDTVAGAGQDVAHAGHAVTNAADGAK